MEGILFLLLLYWLFKKAKKPGKKGRRQKKWVSEMIRQMEKAARSKPSPKPEANPEPEAVPAFQPLAEGESYMAFTQDAHGCVSEREEYMGSLYADTSEGEDACDPLLGHERREPVDAESVYANEIGKEPVLDLSAKGLYQGVVMSEILARSQRRAVRRF